MRFWHFFIGQITLTGPHYSKQNWFNQIFVFVNDIDEIDVFTQSLTTLRGVVIHCTVYTNTVSAKSLPIWGHGGMKINDYADTAGTLFNNFFIQLFLYAIFL